MKQSAAAVAFGEVVAWWTGRSVRCNPRAERARGACWCARRRRRRRSGLQRKLVVCWRRRRSWYRRRMGGGGEGRLLVCEEEHEQKQEEKDDDEEEEEEEGVCWCVRKRRRRRRRRRRRQGRRRRRSWCVLDHPALSREQDSQPTCHPNLPSCSLNLTPSSPSFQTPHPRPARAEHHASRRNLNPKPAPRT